MRGTVRKRGKAWQALLTVRDSATGRRLRGFEGLSVPHRVGTLEFEPVRECFTRHQELSVPPVSFGWAVTSPPCNARYVPQVV
jgi:hypothetical protein